MARIFADKKFVGTWKCTTKIKEVIFNETNLNFPAQVTKILYISNTQGGTIMYFSVPGPESRGIPAVKASGIGVQFVLSGQNDKYKLKEDIRINIKDNANLIGESVQEWSLPGKGVVAKLITRSDYHRVGRMKN
jgi:hypothetical protein